MGATFEAANPGCWRAERSASLHNLRRVTIAGIDVGLQPVHLGGYAGVERQQTASEENEVVAFVRRGVFDRSTVGIVL